MVVSHFSGLTIQLQIVYKLLMMQENFKEKTSLALY